MVRSAGLPWAWLDELRDAEAGDAVDRAGDAEAVASTRCRLADADAAVVRVAARPAFQLAVASSNPDVYATTLLPFLNGEPRKRRQRRRAVVALLQRFAAKNDTANGFGPMDALVLGGTAEPSWKGSRQGERRGVLTWWATQMLADAAAEDPAIRSHLPHRVHSMARVAGGSLRLDDVVVPLSDGEQAALVRIGTAGGAGDDAALARLRGEGLVRRDLLVAPAQDDPAAWLVAHLHRVDSEAGHRWAERVEEIRCIAQRCAEGPASSRGERLHAVEARISDLVGRDVGGVRRARQFYADRRVIYEEGRRGGRLHVGARLAARLVDETATVCRVAAALGYSRHLQARARLRDVVGPERRPLVEMLRAIRADARPFTELRGGPLRFHRRLLKLVSASSAVDVDDVEDLLDGMPQPDMAFASPDVLLEGRPGAEPRLVLGELHHHFQVLGHLQMFEGDGDILEWFDSTFGDRRAHMAQPVAPRDSGKVYYPEWGRWTIEFEARALGRGVAAGAVDVRWDGDAPTLVMPDGSTAELLPVDPADALYLALSPFLAELPSFAVGEHTPEVTVGELVVQRERWQLAVPRMASADVAERWVAARRWRAAHHLPERCFVKADDQPKPFFVDFASPDLCDLFWHWCRRSTVLGVTPAMPAGDGLWLDEGGARYASELRLSAVVHGGASSRGAA